MFSPYLIFDTKTARRCWDQDEAHERLLIGYATGSLDEALALLVRSYVEINTQAFSSLRHMQSLCGALLEDVAPVEVSRDCRARIMDALDDAGDVVQRERRCESHEELIPQALHPYFAGMGLGDLSWHHKRRGVDVAPVRGLSARMLRVQPGVAPVRPMYNTVRFTLVLDGALVQDGEAMPRGSLHVTTPNSREPVSTCAEKGCVALSTQENFCSLARLLTFLWAV